MKGVSLFANVGIAETYLAQNGIDIVVSNELLEDRVKFHKELYPQCEAIVGDITKKDVYLKVLESAKEKGCEFLLATPPCQGMSIAGKMAENDPRNSLIKYVVKMIKDLKPKYVIIENVPTMLSTYLSVNGKKVKIVDYIQKQLKGYFINYKIVDSADYGTPQKRRRTIFLISSIAKWEFPKPQKKITVREAIGHLPSLEHSQTSDIPYHYAKKHNPRHTLALKHTPTGRSALENKVHYPKKKDGTPVKGFLTTYKRIEWDKPSPTITMANGSISSQNNVHPGRKLSDGTYSDARTLTLKEIFILTGLPESWQPPKWARENFIREVIGEGVPPRLIEALVRNMPQ